MRDDALFLRLGDVAGDGFRVDRGRIDVEAVTGLQHFADEQPDGQRDRRHGLEVDQGFKPTRPTRLRSPIEEMPCTTVQKITGAIIILISAMKPSPSGFRALPRSG